MTMGWIIVGLGIVQIAIGSFFVYYGQNVIRKEEKPIMSQLDKDQRVLSPQAEKLLTLIYKYQKELGEIKLIISSTDGEMGFDDKTKREKHKINLIGELFGIPADFKSMASEFERVMLSIPDEYLRRIPEMRLGSPYVVQITERGIQYLK